MARYFFNSDNGEHVEDRDGTELPDVETALAAAQDLAEELLAQKVVHLWPDGVLRITLLDETGLILAVLEMTATIVTSPAIHRP
ncbi:MAG TPA: hypothetical protein VHW05_16705 [Phenylobacterium sp.]|jgi:hypothetical protein|nr:hypothetical protein [Phenylobacterium sp.]